MRRMTLLVLGLALCAACEDDPSAQERDLTTLRQATITYHDITAAAAAGWDAPITACLTDPDSTGAMGFHYGKAALINDQGALAVDQPELLLYEPGAGDTMRLVGVEYVVPYAAHSRDSTPPELFGQPFKQVDAFQLWGLHVWAWRDNPAGLYADWNPDVSCAATANVAVMRHHNPSTQ